MRLGGGEANDDTSEMALGIKALRNLPKLTVLKHEKNLGYGGNQYFFEKGFDIVVLLHGDGQYAPEILSYMYCPIVRGEADADEQQVAAPAGSRDTGAPARCFDLSIGVKRKINAVLHHGDYGSLNPPQQLFPLPMTGHTVRRTVRLAPFEQPHLHPFQQAGRAACVQTPRQAGRVLAITPHDFRFDIMPVPHDRRAAARSADMRQLWRQVHTLHLQHVELLPVEAPPQLRESAAGPAVEQFTGAGPTTPRRSFPRE
jgi:hypothetical protein